jgi:uncharacterized protein
MKKYLRALGNVVLYVVAFYVAYMPVLLLYMNMGKVFPSIKSWLDQNFMVVYLGCDFAGILLIFLIMKLKKKTVKTFINLAPISTKNIAAAIIAGVAMGALTTAVARIDFIAVNAKEIPDTMKVLTDCIPLIYIPAVITNSIFKETLFRGLIFEQIRKVIPVGVALVVQGLIHTYVLMYPGIGFKLYGVAAAMLMGTVYLLSRSLRANLIAQLSAYLAIYATFRTSFITASNAYAVAGACVAVVAVSFILIARMNSVKIKDQGLNT